MLPDSEAREQLDLVVLNIADQRLFPSAFGIDSWVLVVPILLGVALDKSSAYARGERPEVGKIRHFASVKAASEQVAAEIAAAKARHPSALGRQAPTGGGRASS